MSNLYNKVKGTIIDKKDVLNDNTNLKNKLYSCRTTKSEYKFKGKYLDEMNKTHLYILAKDYNERELYKGVEIEYKDKDKHIIDRTEDNNKDYFNNPFEYCKKSNLRFVILITHPVD